MKTLRHNLSMGFLLALTIGAGCVTPPIQSVEPLPPVPPASTGTGQGILPRSATRAKATHAVPKVVPPIDERSGYLPTYKQYGEFISDRFHGYHTGEDIEVPQTGNVSPIVPVRAVADGTVVFAGHAKGYGGVIVVQHRLDGEDFQTLYGHLEMASSALRQGDPVRKGQFVANLGAHHSEDTDGARQHLHFGVYRGSELRLRGYVDSPEALADWTNPRDFFARYGVRSGSKDDVWIPSSKLIYPQGGYTGLSFSIAPDWDVEYVPALDALNLFESGGIGTARQRSRIFIENTRDVRDPAEQPSWRKDTQNVTEQGPYVFAPDPSLDPFVFERFLASVRLHDR